MNASQKANLRYHKAVAKMESEAKRAKAKVTLLKMLYKEMMENQKKETK